MTLFTGRLTGCQRDGDNFQNTEPGSMLSREREHDFSPGIERTLISFVLVNSVFLNSASRASDSPDSALQTFPGRHVDQQENNRINCQSASVSTLPRTAVVLPRKTG